jgi:hypothetical protein
MLLLLLLLLLLRFGAAAPAALASLGRLPPSSVVVPGKRGLMLSAAGRGLFRLSASTCAAIRPGDCQLLIDAC